MSCPNEETFARMQAGLLSHIESENLHRHLDNCPACLELAGVLGCIANSASGSDGSDADSEKRVRSATESKMGHSSRGVTNGPLGDRSRDCVLAQGVLALAHGYFTLAVVPLFWRVFMAGSEPASVLTQLGSLGRIFGTYVVVWGLSGLLWALVGCVGLLTKRRWAHAAVVGYAVLSMPSIVLVPLAICVLVAIKRRTAARLLRDVHLG
jgi:hypothetical protein